MVSYKGNVTFTPSFHLPLIKMSGQHTVSSELVRITGKSFTLIQHKGLMDHNGLKQRPIKFFFKGLDSQNAGLVDYEVSVTSA